MNTSNKRIFKKHISIILAFLILTGLFFLVSCANKEKQVIKASDDDVIISVTEDELSNLGEIKLLDYMKELKNRGEIDFTESGGMITSINGIKNSDKYWMLYTSDAEKANPVWGIIEYDKKEIGSAVCGADELTIKPETLYIWVYKAVN